MNRTTVITVMAFAISLAFFSVIGLMLFIDPPTGSKEVLYIMLGSLGTAWSNVVSYYFGSSLGSARKTDMLASRNGKDPC